MTKIEHVEMAKLRIRAAAALIEADIVQQLLKADELIDYSGELSLRMPSDVTWHNGGIRDARTNV